MPGPPISTSFSYSEAPAESMIEFKVGGTSIGSFTYKGATNLVSLTERFSPINLKPPELLSWVVDLRKWINETITRLGPAVERSSDFSFEVAFDQSVGEVTVSGEIAGLVVGISYLEAPNRVRLAPRDGADLKWSDFLRFVDIPSSLLAIVQREYPAAF